MQDRFETRSATYEVVECLREGVSGSTYHVRRVGDEQSLILKTLTIGKIGDWKEYDLFEREVATLKAIDHPCIPRWVDSQLDETTGIFMHVQTRVDGVSLEQLLADRSSLSAEQTESYLRQSLGLLDYLHSRSPPVIHRDLKPSNIMIADDRIHLIDFGAVKVGRRDSTSMTTVGTFGYMAPEQLLGRAEVRSDLFGLGMTFVTLATGCSPSELPIDPTTGQVDPRSILVGPPHLTRVLLALIRPGLNERPATARAALDLLSQPVLPPVRHPARPSLVPIAHAPRLSPYRFPLRIPAADKAYLMGHTLRRFPVWAAVLLHFMTFGLFSLIHYGAQHEKFPKAVKNDPGALRGIGFNFIPYFHFYWGIFNPLRLTDRINLQYQLRGAEPGVSRGLIGVCSALGIIPYLNLVLGVPFWAFGVVALQKGINELADEATGRKALAPARRRTPGASPRASVSQATPSQPDADRSSG